MSGSSSFQKEQHGIAEDVKYQSPIKGQTSAGQMYFFIQRHMHSVRGASCQPKWLPKFI